MPAKRYFLDTPNRADPERAWPKYSIIGLVVAQITDPIFLVSKISTTLRLISQSKQNALGLISAINKGILNLVCQMIVR